MFNCTFSLDTKRQKKGGNVFYVPEIGVNADANLQLSGAELNLQRINQAISVAQEDYAFNNKVIDLNIESAIEAAERNIKDIMLDRDVADLNVEANRMLRPSKLPYQPKPVKPPERIFLDRMEVIVPKKLKNIDLLKKIKKNEKNKKKEKINKKKKKTN